MSPVVPKQYEPFMAGFTGMLTTFVAANGLRYVFNKPGVRIEKDRRYMMVIEGTQIKMLPLLM